MFIQSNNIFWEQNITLKKNIIQTKKLKKILTLKYNYLRNIGCTSKECFIFYPNIEKT